MLRYFCHQCHAQLNADELLPDFTCPSCHSGFIEEMTTQPPVSSRRSSAPDDPNRADSDDERSGFYDSARFDQARMSSEEFSDDNSEVEFVNSVNGPLAQVFSIFQPQQSTTIANSPAPASNIAGQNSNQDPDNPSAIPGQARAQRSQARTTSSGPTQIATYLDNATSQSLADVLNDFLHGVSSGTHYPEGSSSSTHGSEPRNSGPALANQARGLINIDFPMPIFLHSHPGDYAWGNANFDAVITQLVNNLDSSNSGPAPMPREQIDKLPTVKINADQLKGKQSQCAICMDEYQIGDITRQLPCEHFFHQDCILPWLNLHASCPVCRETFGGADAAQNQSPGANESTSTINPANSSHNSAGTSSNAATSPTSRNISSSPSITNRNPAPNYDYTEDDCD